MPASTLNQIKDEAAAVTNNTIDVLESGSSQARRRDSSDDEWQAGASLTQTDTTRTYGTRQTLAEKMKEIEKAASAAKKNALDSKQVTFKDIMERKNDVQDAATNKMEQSKEKAADMKQKAMGWKDNATAKVEATKDKVDAKVAEQKQKVMEMKDDVTAKATDAKDKVEAKVAEQKQKAMQMKEEATAKAADAKKMVEFKVAEQKQKAMEMKEAATAKADEAKKMMESKAADLNKTVMEQKQKAMEMKEQAVAQAAETKKMVESKVSDAKAAVMEQKAALEKSAAELQSTIKEQKEAITKSANEIKDQAQAAYNDVSEALAPVAAAGSEIRKRLPRKRVMVAGLGVAAAAAGIGYWIYKTYYADGSESVDLVAEDAGSSSSWTLTSWFGSSSDGDAATAAPAETPAAEPSLLGSWFGSSTTTSSEAGAPISDEATTLMSAVGNLIDTEKAAELVANVPDMAGAAMTAVEGVLKQEEVQTALRGITREFFTQLDVLNEIFAEQQKGIMAYLNGHK